MRKQQVFDYDVTVVIMGGGAGTRLAPLTNDRAKPAVPIGGKYRLIDIPISNCINSGFNRMYILTQFNSTSLHRHVNTSYHFHRFSKGFVEILAAQQTPASVETGHSWYLGTADAVRMNLARIRDAAARDVLILSGDQIYAMDFRDIMRTHRGTGDEDQADVTLGAVLVSKERARDLGVLRVDETGEVEAFVEKPGNDDSKFEGLEAAPALLERFGVDPETGPWYLGNMGIYVFGLEVLEDSLDNDYNDFGKEVLPSLLGERTFRAHVFDDYWEDIGTVGAFHEANLDLARAMPRFNFFDGAWPIYTRPRLLPASKIGDLRASNSSIADGCILDEGVVLEHSLVGVRSVVREGAELRRTYVMGNDYYETEEDREENAKKPSPHDPDKQLPNIGIGKGTIIENAIVDKDCRIGEGVRLVNDSGELEREEDDRGVSIREGVICVSRHAVVEDGYRL